MGPHTWLNAAIGHGTDRCRERRLLNLAAANCHSGAALNSSKPERKRNAQWRTTGGYDNALCCLVRCARISVGRATTSTTLSIDVLASGKWRVLFELKPASSTQLPERSVPDMRVRALDDALGQRFQLNSCARRICRRLERALAGALPQPFEDEFDQEVRLERCSGLKLLDLVFDTFQPLDDRRIGPTFRRCKQQGQRLIDQRADMDTMLGGKLLYLVVVRLGDADMKPWIARHVLKLPSAIFLDLKVVARDLVLNAAALLRCALILRGNVL